MWTQAWQSYPLQIQFRRGASLSRKAEKQAGKENDEAGYNQYSLVARVVEEFGWISKEIGDVLFHDSDSTLLIARVPLRVSTSKVGATPKNVRAYFVDSTDV